MRVLAASMLALPLATAGLGCRATRDERAREYMPDMARNPAYKAFEPNPVTRDGLTLQPPVEGTLARGHMPFHYGPGEEEAARAGRELSDAYRPTPETLADGKLLYETYCLVCHGEQGHGDGPIASKIPHPPSYTSARVLAFPPGRIFHVITMGSGRMRSYAAQLTPKDRWKIVTYVKASLQHQDVEPASLRRGRP